MPVNVPKTMYNTRIRKRETVALLDNVVHLFGAVLNISQAAIDCQVFLASADEVVVHVYSRMRELPLRQQE